MKRSKKDFGRFSKRNTHKRKSKERARNELLRAVAETGVGTDSLKVKYTYDGGRGARGSKPHREETVAQGVFSEAKGGYGFVSVEGRERDIFISEGATLGAIDGDLVEIIYREYTTRYGEEKTEGRVSKILEYGKKTLIGTVAHNSSARRRRRSYSEEKILIPDDSKISIRPLLIGAENVSVGDKVEARLDRKNRFSPEATVIRNFGNTYSREANYEAILAECDITVDFTKEELCEAEFFAAVPLSYEGRMVRDKDIIFTIDGEDAKDLDDAISLKRVKGGIWQLGVHIADVSHYIKERGHLDRAVMARGTSVYFTDKVVPMLPPVLSNGVCSLNAGEDKYAISAIINLSPEGEILSLKLEPSVIRSRVRGVYSEVNSIFEDTATPEITAKYKPVIPTLMKMRELYFVLRDRSRKRGSLELETAEAKILLSESGEPMGIVKRERGDAEKMIEQFMLTANEAVATRLHTEGVPCVYRVHENPPEDKLTEFINYAHNLGLDTREVSRSGADAKAFSHLLAEATERGIGAPVSYSMLRAMSKARYSEVKASHFGLGIDSYCHFTSPIRRLSDLATHRIIHRVLFEGKRKEAYSSYARRAAAAATESELKALSAERKIENLYKVIYMESFVGEEFSATVSSVTQFGMFAELENTCEGLVPISEMDGVFFFDEKNLALRSRDRIYRLGDTVRVRLEEADRIKGKLRFSLVEDCDE